MPRLKVTSIVKYEWENRIGKAVHYTATLADAHCSSFGQERMRAKSSTTFGAPQPPVIGYEHFTVAMSSSATSFVADGTRWRCHGKRQETDDGEDGLNVKQSQDQTLNISSLSKSFER